MQYQSVNICMPRKCVFCWAHPILSHPKNAYENLVERTRISSKFILSNRFKYFSKAQVMVCGTVKTSKQRKTKRNCQTEMEWRNEWNDDLNQVEHRHVYSSIYITLQTVAWWHEPSSQPTDQHTTATTTKNPNPELTNEHTKHKGCVFLSLDSNTSILHIVVIDIH